jgi:hypothetical protein
VTLAEVSRYERRFEAQQGERNTKIRECCIIGPLIVPSSLIYLQQFRKYHDVNECNNVTNTCICYTIFQK